MIEGTYRARQCSCQWESGSWEICDAHLKPARNILTNGWQYYIPGYGYHAWNPGCGVATDYDALCYRFGAPRVNTAIRNRIWSNRARRILQNAPVSRETANVG